MLRRECLAIAVLLLGPGLVVWSAESSATTLIRAGIPELASRSELVVEGRVVSSRVVRSDAAPNIFTDVVVEVVEVFRGGGLGERIEVRVPGGDTGRGVLRVEGMPTLREGSQVVLFLDRLPSAVSPDAPRWGLIAMWQSHLELDGGGQTFARTPAEGVALVTVTPWCTGGEERNTFEAAELRAWLRANAGGGEVLP